MSYKWNEVIFNVDQGENFSKTNEDYFRWIYTGITRAKEKLNLVNYKPINPFLKNKIKDANKGEKPGKEIFFIADPEAKLTEFDITTIRKYNFSEEHPIHLLLQIYQLLSSKLKSNNISIDSIQHSNFQEIYKFKGMNGEQANISIYYNKKGQFKFPKLITSQPKDFGEKVIKLLNTNIEIDDFKFIKDRWREDIYNTINDRLKE